MSFPFYFDSIASPTSFNLRKHLLASRKGYESSSLKKARFTQNHLKLENTLDTELLEHKHKLAALVEKYCPSIMPTTYYLSDANYPMVLQEIKQTYYQQEDNIDHLAWILKPALLNNGNGIRLFNCFSELQNHYQNSHRYAGPHVLQRYLTNPHLLNGHKYTFRMFIIVTNFAGSYFYPEGYFNVCCEAYTSNDFSAITPHLTNEHLNPDDSQNVYQIPTSRCPNFHPMQQQMQQIARAVATAFHQENQKAAAQPSLPQLGLFGFDYLVDNHLDAWLLEINHGPCFPKQEEHLLQKPLYNNFWQSVIQSFVEPIANDSNLVPASSPFIKIAG